MGSVGQQKRYSSGWKSTDKNAVTRVARAQKQNYEQLRQQCNQSGQLFEDPEFPASDRSVFYSQPRQFVWKRPGEITQDPRVFVGGASRFDIKQGDLGNCWFLAAVASLCASGNKQLLKKVIPDDNSFQDKYGGIFRFKFWQYGQWVDVVIDDRLPTLNGRLVFLHSAEGNEFWSALLEKAYAKLMGSYEALRGGCAAEAMEDFCGGICEIFNTKKDLPANFFEIMWKANNKGCMMAATIDASPGQIEAIQGNGLVIGHAYSITAVKKVTGNFAGGSSPAQLIRVRNPWGNEYEWKGAWSDSSPEWKNVSDAEKKRVGLSFDDDGEFWMSYDDFVANYHKIEICNMGPDSPQDESGVKKHWEATVHHGEWKDKVNAGGCRNFLDTFWTNPQYRAQVCDADEGDADNTGTIIIGLMQKERRKKRSQGLDLLTLGYSIYKLPDPSCGPLDLNFFKYNAAVGRSTFSNMREVCGRFKLEPGHYCVIPQTFKPREEADFLVRIYSERACPAGEIDEETGLIGEEDEQKDPHAKAVKAETKAAGEALSEAEVEARKRRLRAKRITEDDVNEERNVRELFRKTAGEDLELDAYELRKLLNSLYLKEFKGEGFSLETCRSMIAMMDADKSGKLGYEEFKKMWADLRTWKKIFLEFDADKSGTFNSFELRQALNSAGIRVSNSTFNALVMRYTDQEGRIFFDDFIMCSIRLKSMFETFREVAVGSKHADFTLDEFIQTTMYS